MMRLGPDEQDGDVDQDLRPDQFPSRAAWREALIERRKAQVAHDIGSTLQALRDLSFKVGGGTTSRTVVVEGTAQNILASLELPGVRHASLDRPIQLAEGRDRTKSQADQSEALPCRRSPGKKRPPIVVTGLATYRLSGR